MRDLKLNTDPGPTPEPPKPKPVVYLETIHFDEDVPYYTVKVSQSEGVVVHSECCGDVMSRDTAKKLYYAIGSYLASTSEPSTEEGK